MPGAARSRVGDGLSAGGMVAGIDSLRRLAADVLTYDISGIPDESADETEAYRQDVLSKMSRNDLIRCILLQPTVKLSRTDSNTGYEAQYIQNPLMNLYFTRDQSITTPRDHKLWQMQMHLDTHFNIIDRDLCFRLFTAAGFEWGGDWTTRKDYQHFELVE